MADQAPVDPHVVLCHAVRSEALLEAAASKWGRQSAGPHLHFRGARGGEYGFHFTGVTTNKVPLLELTQPAAVSLQGSFSE